MTQPRDILFWVESGGARAPGTLNYRSGRLSRDLAWDIQREIVAMFYNTPEVNDRNGRHFRSSGNTPRHLPGPHNKPNSISRATIHARLVANERSQNSWVASPKCDGVRSLLYVNAATQEAYLCCGEDFDIASVHRPGTLLPSSGTEQNGFIVPSLNNPNNSRHAKSVLLVGETVWASEEQSSKLDLSELAVRPVFVAHDIAATSLKRGMMFTVPFEDRICVMRSVIESMECSRLRLAAFDRASSTNRCGIHVSMKPFWYSGSEIPSSWWNYFDDGKMHSDDTPMSTPRVILSCGTGSVPTDGIILTQRRSVESDQKHRNRKQRGEKRKRRSRQSATTLKWKPSSMHTTDAIIWIPDLLLAHRAKQQKKNATHIDGWTPPVPFFVRASVLGGANVGVVPAGRPLPRSMIAAGRSTEYLCAPGTDVGRSGAHFSPGPWMHRAGSGGPRYAGYVYGGSVRLPLAANLPDAAFKNGIPIWSGLCVEIWYDHRVTAGWVFRNARFDRRMPNTHQALVSSLTACAENITAAEVLSAAFKDSPDNDQKGSDQPYDPEISCAGMQGYIIPSPPRPNTTPPYVPTSPSYTPASPHHGQSTSPPYMPASPHYDQSTSPSYMPASPHYDQSKFPAKESEHLSSDEPSKREDKAIVQACTRKEMRETSFCSDRVFVAGFQSKRTPTFESPHDEIHQQENKNDLRDEVIGSQSSESSISEGTLNSLLKLPEVQPNVVEKVSSPPVKKRRCSARLRAKRNLKIT